MLKSYIREVLMMNERNQLGLLKKPFSYDLLIADLSSTVMAEIYEDFQSDDLKDSFVSMSSSSAETSFNFGDVNKFEEIIDANQSLIVLKKNEVVIEHLNSDYSFDFSNCDLSDSAPLLCVPAISLLGDVASGSSVEAESIIKIEMLKNQKIKDPEGWNWAAHDLHHGETSMATQVDTNINTGRISKKALPSYRAPKTDHAYMDAHASKTMGRYSVSEGIPDYWLVVIGYYFNKIGFTKGVANRDIWPSIYSYCLTKMSGSEDAYKMDFTIVNEPGKKNLILGKGEIKVLQDFFAGAYKTVHENSFLNKLEDGRIYIAYMFL